MRRVLGITLPTVVVTALAVVIVPWAWTAEEADVTKQPEKPWMVSEASLPEGFPQPGPVDEVIVKTYPAHRLARVTAEGGSNGMFMKLFRHIERNEIKMTAPVEMTWSEEGEKPARDPDAMAFLYGSTAIGTPGADSDDPNVVVEDIPEIKVVSIGLRGAYDEKTFRRGYEKLEAWLAEHPEWEPAGAPRTLGYNSPFVPNFFKVSEVQIPVAPAGS
jgi:effector-binding domain-containing protein